MSLPLFRLLIVLDQFQRLHGGRDNQHRLSSYQTNENVGHPEDQATVMADSQQRLPPRSKEGSSKGQEDGQEQQQAQAQPHEHQQKQQQDQHLDL